MPHKASNDRPPESDRRGVMLLLQSQFFNEPPSLREAFANAQRIAQKAQRTQIKERTEEKTRI
ncbi:hypothetical protein [aff. Roholtiella sp. LEGE 12411]|uniref:hypothetical protein n=1 Tax=aff. Roholtiella sp. LEGE 12411 TaxID=1828822 RepID=UPI00187F73BE|nr:hypothetical protein [aff. Roholtiella sp. LEGE 12411]MBE9038051.1 hypothetical protein [aff. Roholtiella sp. LEGE 12411]